LPEISTTEFTVASDADAVIFGVTLKATAGEEPTISLAEIVWLPPGSEGMVISVALNDPVASVVGVAILVVSNNMLIFSAGLNPLPLILNLSPTIPELVVNVMAGVIVNNGNGVAVVSGGVAFVEIETLYFPLAKGGMGNCSATAPPVGTVPVAMVVIVGIGVPIESVTV
jgi:hypothetical protein